MEPCIHKYNGIIDKFIGDAIMALYPLTADDALKSSISMINNLIKYNKGRAKAGYDPINIGIGINTGYMMLGIVGGKERIETTVISDSVNLAARLEKLTKEYGVKILISEHTHTQLNSVKDYSIRFIDRIKVKGKIQPVSLYEVYDNDNDKCKLAKKESVTMFEEAVAFFHYKEIKKSFKLFKKCIKLNPYDNPAKVYIARCNEYFKTGTLNLSDEIDKKIEWCDEFSVGNKIIDDQHRQLIKTSYALIDEIEKTKDIKKINQFIVLLEEYVKKHFDTEENIMQKANYPFIDIQIRQHRKFTDSLCELKKNIEENFIHNTTFLVFELKVFLIDWTTNHIINLDRHFGNYIRNR